LITGRIGSHTNFFGLQISIVNQCRDMPASAVQVKLPAMIGTLQPCTVKTAKREGHSAMWAQVSQRGNAPLAISTDNEREFEQGLGLHVAWSYCLGEERWIPKT